MLSVELVCLASVVHCLHCEPIFQEFPDFIVIVGPCLVVVLGSLCKDQRSCVRGRGTVASGTVAEIVDVVIRPLGGRTGAAPFEL